MARITLKVVAGDRLHRLDVRDDALGVPTPERLQAALKAAQAVLSGRGLPPPCKGCGSRNCSDGRCADWATTGTGFLAAVDALPDDDSEVPDA